MKVMLSLRSMAAALCLILMKGEEELRKGGTEREQLLLCFSFNLGYGKENPILNHYSRRTLGARFAKFKLSTSY